MLGGVKLTMSTNEKIGGMDAYEVRNAADTLMQAKEIEGKPKLYKLAQAEALKRAKIALEVAGKKKDRAELIAKTKVKLDKL